MVTELNEPKYKCVCTYTHNIHTHICVIHIHITTERNCKSNMVSKKNIGLGIRRSGFYFILFCVLPLSNCNRFG